MSESQTTETVLFLKPTRLVVILLLVLFLLAGIGNRLIDLTDLPLDFSATRQLHSYIMTRGLYYEMETPESLGISNYQYKFGITNGRSEPNIEPPVMETTVALTYRLLGQENMLVARILSALFWVIGGIPLFLLARKVTTWNGAFAALVLYLFNPFSVIASRSFQPDPMMVMLILWALYFQFVWAEKDTLKNALLAGIFTGISVLVKAPSVFFVGFSMIAFIIWKGIKPSLKNWRVYLIAALSLLPAILYYGLSATVGGNSGAIFGARWFPNLFTSPKWYLQWLMLARSVVGFWPIVLSLLGFFFIQERKYKLVYFFMWLGYILYGFMFAYHIYTHNYYHLPLIPIIALGFGVIIADLFSRLEVNTRHWFPRLLLIGLVLFSLGLNVMKSRGDMIGESFRHEAAYWKDLGEKIGSGSRVIALTHDYGYRLSYWGFIQPKLWPTQGDLTVKELIGSTDPEFLDNFKIRTEGMDYFLVTLINDFKSQKSLSTYLLETYPYTEGDGYYLFDLNHPIE